jgi:SulP family sulfate permease
MILAAIAIFYLILGLTGTTILQATELGLMFEPFPAGALWQPPPLDQLHNVEWRAILGRSAEIATLILISSITLLLYASGVEVSTGREINLNQELRASGFANLVAAFSASPPGYVIVTMSVLSNRLGANHRLVGLLVAFFSGLVMFFGAPLISFFPKPVLGGVLTFLGLTFLVEWLVEGLRKLSRADYLMVVVIMLAMSVFSLLTGLAVGIALAVALFIIEYSRVPVVRHILSGRSLRSRVQRPQPQTELLHREGKQLLILELQGYIFFGTANRIYEQLKQRLEEHPEAPLRVVMLDFRRVNGVDASAALSFVRLKRLLRNHGVILAFIQLAHQVQRQLERDVLTRADQESWRLFPDLDHGVEWYEQLVLEGEAGREASILAQPGVVQAGQERGGLALVFAALLAEAEQEEIGDDQGLLHLMNYLERVELQNGALLIRQGEPQPYLYFLEAGEITVEYQTGDSHVVRLESGGPGAITGELSFYLGIPAPATVRAARESILYRLPANDLHSLEREHPHTAALLHRFLLKKSGRRVLNLLEAMETLLD